jgi:hypothetical protein
LNATDKLAGDRLVNGLPNHCPSDASLLDQILIGGADLFVLWIARCITPTECLTEHVANQPHDTTGIVGQTNIEKLIGGVSGIALRLLKSTERMKSPLREQFRTRGYFYV